MGYISEVCIVPLKNIESVLDVGAGKGQIVKWFESIGNDVCIGSNAVILHGVRIGDGAILLRELLLAKFIKKRFSDDKINQLIALS